MSKEITNPENCSEVFDPPLPRPKDIKTLTDIFYLAKTRELVLFPASKTPMRLPEIDFYFGSKTPLESHYIKEGSKYLHGQVFINELMQPAIRFLNWNGKMGRKLYEKYISLLVLAKKIAYLSCHGNTYIEKGEKYWGLLALEEIYNANQVVDAATKENYTLIILTACNPGGLSLDVENSMRTRPTILRFNVSNQLMIPKNVHPIVIVPPVISVK